MGPPAVACVVLLPVVTAYGRRLSTMELGDDAAHALGVPVERTRLALMVAATLLTAAATAAAGPIGFVSLSGADRLPVSAVTGVLGGAYLVWLLVAERRAGKV